jgi:hypothetical protein
MDLNETSAMTEASGLTNDQGHIEQLLERAGDSRLRRTPRCAGPIGCAR